MITIKNPNAIIKFKLEFDPNEFDEDIDLFVAPIRHNQNSVDTGNLVFYNNQQTSCGSVVLSDDVKDPNTTLYAKLFKENFDGAVFFLANQNQKARDADFRFLIELDDGQQIVKNISASDYSGKGVIVLGSLLKTSGTLKIKTEFNIYEESINQLWGMLENHPSCNAAWVSSHCHRSHGVKNESFSLAELTWLKPAELEHAIAERYHPSLAPSQGKVALELLYHRFRNKPLPEQYCSLMQMLIADGAPWWKCLKNSFLQVYPEDDTLSAHDAMEALTSTSDNTPWLQEVLKTYSEDDILFACEDNPELAAKLMKQYKLDFLMPLVDNNTKKELLSDDLGL